MYSVPFSVQLTVFLTSLGVGFLLGIGYDVFRAVRLAAGGGRAVTVAADVLYCLVCGAATFLFLMAANKGEVRGYAIGGEVLGGAFYYVALGPPAKRAGEKAAALLRRSVALVVRAITAPFCLLRRGLSAVGEKTRKKLAKSRKNEQKIRKKLLPKIRLYVYNLFGTFFH